MFSISIILYIIINCDSRERKLEEFINDSQPLTDLMQFIIKTITLL